MLGVQLYDLIAKAGMQQDQVISYYSFMSQLGMAAQAIDIVYQLNAADSADPSVYQKGTSPLESVIFGSEPSAHSRVSADQAADKLSEAESRRGPQAGVGATRYSRPLAS